MNRKNFKSTEKPNKTFLRKNCTRLLYIVHRHICTHHTDAYKQQERKQLSSKELENEREQNRLCTKKKKRAVVFEVDFKLDSATYVV